MSALITKSSLDISVCVFLCEWHRFFILRYLKYYYLKYYYLKYYYLKYYYLKYYYYLQLFSYIGSFQKFCEVTIILRKSRVSHSVICVVTYSSCGDSLDISACLEAAFAL